MSDFVHLHLHSQYSLLDGAIRFRDLMPRVKELGMTAVAITDHGNLFGALEFYGACKEAGIKPIIGCELYIAPGSRHDKVAVKEQESAYHLLLLAMNQEGFKNLSLLSSLGYKEGFYYKPRIDKELLAAHSAGLICLSACLKGEVAYLAERDQLDEARAVAAWYKELFGDRYYLEIQENSLPEQDKANRALVRLAQELDIQLVATNDCHYLTKEDAAAHEVLLCIQTGKTMSDPNRMRFSVDEFYLKSPAEMATAFSYVPQAVANTAVIAERCQLKFEFGPYYFPEYTAPGGQDLDTALAEAARAGLDRRLAAIAATPGFAPELVAGYQARLELELDCIRQMGFSGYFLIVADFINWAKDRDIPVGPGRGSAAGSLVAYAIRITDLDPLPYNLLFERFLNPERVSMPDIDVDFCQYRREEVIRYVTDKYGQEKVCQIITFGTMAARGVLRDVGRALNFTVGDVDRIAKLVPNLLGMTLEKALKLEPRLSELARSDQAVNHLVETALKLEGLCRHASTHAAGVVVAPSRMEDFCPVYKDQKSGTFNTQYSMKYVEKIGLVKFDFLGLKNLTIIDNAVKLIRRSHQADFDILAVPMDDAPTYELLARGDTTGVFQLESSGMKELLAKLKPTCFEDIIAVCALYRPGPLGSGMVDDFVERKHGRRAIVYDLPQLEPILKDTYGVIVYQEQVMQIAQVLAGYTLGGADLLRRAMGKKIAAEMAKQRGTFIAGAVANGVAETLAASIFDLMEKFAEYGFNKSHSAAYALIAYQTAFLKAHYPVEFMAALLSSDMGNSDKELKNIAECRDMGLTVLPPDLNRSEREFLVEAGAIRYGLGAVKNVGEGAIESIVAVRRAGGPFADIYDFCNRIDLRAANKRVVESLIKAGVFDSTGARRSQLSAGLDDVFDLAGRYQKERASAQIMLFAGDDQGASLYRGTLPQLREWDDKEKLAAEKEVLGFFFSGHPLAHYARQLAHLAPVRIADLTERQDGSSVRVCGIITQSKVITTKKGEQMAFVQLEDQTGSVELTIFPRTYRQAVADLAGDEPLLVTASVEIDDEKGLAKLKAEEIVPFRDLPVQLEMAQIRVPEDRATPANLAELVRLAAIHHGRHPCQLALVAESGATVLFKLPMHLTIAVEPELAEQLAGLFGADALQLVAAGPVAA